MKKLIVCLFLFCCLKNHAQVCWMSGTNIVGEGTGVHSGEMPVLAMQNLMVDTIITTGGSTGATVHWGLDDLKFKIQFNKSSVALFSAFRNGQNLSTITIKFWYQKPDASFAAWTTIVLDNVQVTGYKLLAPECTGSNCNIPLIEIAMNWRKMTLSDDFGNSSILDKQTLGL